MFRFCPSCHTERPLTEIMCDGVLDGGVRCNWDLSNEETRQPGWQPATYAPSQVEGESASVPPGGLLSCPNGHEVDEGDLLCFVCHAPLAAAASPPQTEATAPANSPPTAAEKTRIASWRILSRLDDRPNLLGRFIVEHVDDARTGQLSLLRAGAPFDRDVADLLPKLPTDHAPAVLEIGRWEETDFIVEERLSGASLVEITIDADATEILRAVVQNVAAALDFFAQQGLRHRALQPTSILVRAHDPLDLVISDFSAAQLSDYDIETTSSLSVNRYTAPEAVVGGVTAASDWWSLGMVLLDRLTDGACFAGADDRTFLIHVLTRGIEIPSDLPENVRALLRGLLVKDRVLRWQRKEVTDWLDGVPQSVPTETSSAQDDLSSGITLGDRTFHNAQNFVIAAASETHWDAACDLLARGMIAHWLKGAKAADEFTSGLRNLQRADITPEAFRLSLALKILSPDLPLVYRGDIVTPGWLLDHPDLATELINGSVPEFLQRIDPDRAEWLLQLRERSERIGARLEALDIETDPGVLRVVQLSGSRQRLMAQWEEKRKLFPETQHPNLATLFSRAQLSDEDLIVLLAASPTQFQSADEILTEATAVAAGANIREFDRAAAATWLNKPRRQLWTELDDRLAGFAACRQETPDQIASRFRLERRIPLAQALALLAIPKEAWEALPKHAYITSILDFFERKLAASVQTGPLVRFIINPKTTPRIDISELTDTCAEARAMLDRFLARNAYVQRVDPQRFLIEPRLEPRFRRLASTATLFQRDTGVNGLYLGFPFLVIQGPDTKIRPRVAPIILWPMKLRAEVGARADAWFSFDSDRGEPRLNPALDSLLGLQTALRWKEALRSLLTHATLTAEAVTDGLSHLARSSGVDMMPVPDAKFSAPANSIEIRSAAALFHAAFMAQAIIEDVRKLKQDGIQDTALETMLRSENTQPSTFLPEVPVTPELDRYFTISSDPSQEDAVLLSRAAPGIVIKGPPGTGKSQTIVNGIGDAIGRSENLLVVCQKLPALEVVRKRLVAEGLGSRIIMITDAVNDRRAVLTEIREQIQSLNQRDLSQTIQVQREGTAKLIEHIESELDRNAISLKSVDPIAGMTYRGILSALIELEHGDRPIELPLLRSKFANKSPGDLSVLIEACAPLVRWWLPSRFEEGCFSPLAEFSGDEGTVALFVDALDAFAKTEEARLRAFTNLETQFALADSSPAQAWVAPHRERLTNLSEREATDLVSWLSLFFDQSTPHAAGDAKIAAFDDFKTALDRLAAYDAGFFTSLLGHDAAELTLWVSQAETIVTPTSFWQKLNPNRMIRKQAVKRFVTSAGKTLSPETAGKLAVGCRTELALRVLRPKLGSALASLGLPDDVSQQPPKVLSSIAAEVASRLRAVAEIASIIKACPERTAAIKAASAASTAGFRPLFVDFDNAHERWSAYSTSLASLQELAVWTNADWREKLRNRLSTQLSTAEFITPIRLNYTDVGAWQNFRLRSRNLSPEGFALLATLRQREVALRALPPSSLDSETRRTLRREWLLARKAVLESAEPALLMERAEIEEKVRRLAALDLEMRGFNQKFLLHNRRGATAPLSQWEDITRLQGARAIRLREFIDRAIPLGLFALRPVWLMTPDVASQLLPLVKGLFDVVFYDEASQMPVDYALPTLYRAKRVAVSGDEQQMPPSSFFAGRIESDEDEVDDVNMGETYGDAAADQIEESWNRRDIKDCPDLLHLAQSALPVATLQIHYRSEYRDLIGFSNAAYYGGRLSIPARHPDAEVRMRKPIEVIRVDGLYEKQTNQDEARRVVETLAAIWVLEKRPSVGIVTFNKKQADLIEEMIEARCGFDDAFRQAYTAESERRDHGEDMSLFVKNVETVQGDERDVIIFSTTFGRNDKGVFRRAFGALVTAGGERRLNVAVTRARTKVIVLTSMPIDEISNFLTGTGRPTKARDFLQAYMAYAVAISSGDLDHARAILHRFGSIEVAAANRNDEEMVMDGFSRSVEEFISSLGYVPVAGTNDVFGVDFAIVDQRTRLFGIGIECDAPSHRLLSHARAREIWRPSILRRSLPALHRVSSYAWYHSGDEERQRLADAIRTTLTRELAA